MTQGLRSNTAHFCSLEKAGRMEPFLILSCFSGLRDNEGFM